jgi:hypothetical protein
MKIFGDTMISLPAIPDKLELMILNLPSPLFSAKTGGSDQSRMMTSPWDDVEGESARAIWRRCAIAISSENVLA